MAAAHAHYTRLAQQAHLSQPSAQCPALTWKTPFWLQGSCAASAPQRHDTVDTRAQGGQSPSWQADGHSWPQGSGVPHTPPHPNSCRPHRLSVTTAPQWQLAEMTRGQGGQGPAEGGESGASRVVGQLGGARRGGDGARSDSTQQAGVGSLQQAGWAPLQRRLTSTQRCLPSAHPDGTAACTGGRTPAPAARSARRSCSRRARSGRR